MKKKKPPQNPPNEGLEEEISTRFFPWNILQLLLLGNTTLHVADCRAKMFLCLCPSYQIWLFKTGFSLTKKVGYFLLAFT